jgi:hypothetical protein
LGEANPETSVVVKLDVPKIFVFLLVLGFDVEPKPLVDRLPRALNKLELLEAGLFAPSLEDGNGFPRLWELEASPDDGCPPPKLNLNKVFSGWLVPLDSVVLFSVGLAPSAVDSNKGLWEVLAVLNRLVAPLGAPKADLPGGPETLLVEATA